MMKVIDLRESELFLFSEVLTIRDVLTHDTLIIDCTLSNNDNVVNEIPHEYDNRKVLMIQPFNNELIISLI